MRAGAILSSSVFGFLAASAAGIDSSRAVAGDWSASVELENPIYKYEAWAGADATSHSRSFYGGMTTSLSGDIRVDGFRVRSAAGYGTYAYTSLRWNGIVRVPVHFDGVQTFTDLMLGYQQAFGPWIVKVFVGGSQDQHVIAPYDIENSVQGQRMGVKAAIETWLNIADRAFLQTETSWSQVFDTTGARVRAGYRINPAISAGLEGAYNANTVYEAGRLGSFARFEWSRGEISASGGVAGDRAGANGGYGTVNAMFRF